jgi:hypothetical protein
MNDNHYFVIIGDILVVLKARAEGELKFWILLEFVAEK